MEGPSDANSEALRGQATDRRCNVTTQRPSAASGQIHIRKEEYLNMKIVVYYEACDDSKLTKSYKTLQGARKFAQTYVGKCPDIGGGYYAVSDDGVGRVMVEGCTIFELFGIDRKAYYS